MIEGVVCITLASFPEWEQARLWIEQELMYNPVYCFTIFSFKNNYVDEAEMERYFVHVL